MSHECPVCGDLRDNGKCSNCGYDPLEDKKDDREGRGFAFDGGRPTELPDLDKLHIDEVRRIWIHHSETIASQHGRVPDKVYEWTGKAWFELEDRVNPDYPECPECGATCWSQSLGEPKYCSECGLELGLQHEELTEAIESEWKKIRTHDDPDVYKNAIEVVPVLEEDELVTDGGTAIFTQPRLENCPECGRTVNRSVTGRRCPYCRKTVFDRGLV